MCTVGSDKKRGVGGLALVPGPDQVFPPLVERRGLLREHVRPPQRVHRAQKVVVLLNCLFFILDWKKL